MDGKKLPQKLTTEPLIDAVFEVRFTSTGPGSVTLPGIFIAKLPRGNQIAVEKLAADGVPAQLRSMDPALQYAPLVRLVWGNFYILIGDRSLAVACRLPYPGWQAFKAAILEVVQQAIEARVFQSLSRYSLKYVDLIPGEDRAMQIKRMNWDIRVGEHKLQSENFSLRIEVPEGPVNHVVQIVTAAVAVVEPPVSADPVHATRREEKRGAIIDIDSVVNHTTGEPQAFFLELATRLEELHASNKRMFFSCLTAEAIDELGAQYAE